MESAALGALLLLLLLSLTARPSSCFNMDVSSPIAAAVPPSSPHFPPLFGYSLALNTSALYVGAPGHGVGGDVFK